MKIARIFKSVFDLAKAGQKPMRSTTMQKKQIDDDFYISGQVGFSDLKGLADEGIKSLICARPDLEEGNQPLFEELAAEAQKHGLKTLHVPIRPGQATEQDVEKFAQGIKTMPKPILGFCRSGARAHGLYQLALEH
jgi:sulfide:quinone oxidoreductase